MYGVAITLFVIYEIMDIGYQYIYLLKIGRQTDRVFGDIVEYLEYVYFGFYSLILIFYLVSVRTVDTQGYSPVTLKAYKRMALVHFVQVTPSFFLSWITVMMFGLYS